MYDYINDKLMSWNCQLLTSKEEFILANQGKKTKIKYIGSCGHESESMFHNMEDKHTHYSCKSCRDKFVSRKLTGTQPRGGEVEYKGICELTALISERFEIIRTNEGCLADLALRKMESQEDLWLPVQIKVTQKKGNNQ